jgi:hypothetical protein
MGACVSTVETKKDKPQKDGEKTNSPNKEKVTSDSVISENLMIL